MPEVKHYNGHSMVGQLQLVLVCSPQAAGWDQVSAAWRDLGFDHQPDFAVAQQQHHAMCHQLEAAGAEDVFSADEVLSEGLEGSRPLRKVS